MKEDAAPRTWHDWLLFAVVAGAAVLDAARREEASGAGLTAALGLTLAATMLCGAPARSPWRRWASAR